ncbi:cell wall-binding repeat-containing protein [Paradesulfitobacterium ferrireducens]|uniref:cell wall-binding repeat-containing protein n=1 Tax=Paradesulfitobacterium ferrireducens TaxID=2816476 RepID=UPI001A8C0440|nr:cell wall-binding repeat-containing protein [Paradesulfitobacterium ferrireducens]
MREAVAFYATAVNIAKELENQGAAVNQVALTTGLSQADALSIAPVAAGKGMPILLTAPGQLPAVVQEYLAAKRATVNKSYVIGGIGAVSETAAVAMPGSVTRLDCRHVYQTEQRFFRVYKLRHPFPRYRCARG